VNPLATQSLTLNIGQQPAITSLDNTTFVVGSSGTFTVTSSGYPYPAFTSSGSLPTGVSLTDNLDGTATLGGTPTDGTGGIFLFTITADNGIVPQAEQAFTLTVNEAPEITSSDQTNFNVNTAGEFSFTTDGYPLATISFTSTPNLPTSITLVDNNDGTGTLSGTPQAGDGGGYTISLTADNGIDPNGTQSFTLTIGESPVITSADTATFVESNPGSFTITTSGTPLPTITYSGELPEGVTIQDQGDGTAILSGTPTANTAKTYPITINATNGVGGDASQAFSLVVISTAGVVSINSIEDSGDGYLSENERTNVDITQLLVTFNRPMDLQTVMNSANYNLQKDESAISIDLVLYNALEQTATLFINSGLTLQDGDYKLTVSGQILDELGYPIGNEFVRNFSVDTISIEIVPFGFTLEDGTILKEGMNLTRTIQSLKITFTEDAANPTGDIESEDVTNPKNYLLVQAGLNNKFETTSCELGVAIDDVQIPVGPIVYDKNNGDGPFTASLNLNNGKAIPNGLYRLFVCGSTSINDLAGNKLNEGNDETLTFSIQVLSAVESLPSTGFVPGVFTNLVAQPPDLVYESLGDLWLELPTQGIKASITGIPWQGNDWDLTWLNQQIGWLEGTAFPTWKGNTVLTAHAYKADGTPGPFAYLKNLMFGDIVIIHYQGMKYTYALRSRLIVSPRNTALLSRVEKNDWLTLITCHQYDETTQTYLYRTVIRAILVTVEEES
ncbi:MAG: sortase, partial [Anaerolineaceae bacterium]|nr:sortase [Anaerolineaceae bacterium]